MWMSTKKRKKERLKDGPRAARVLSDNRFAGQHLKLQDESVHCEACGKYVNFVEVKYMLEHCYGSDIERFFSRLKASTTDLMTLEHDETLETRAFCMYNK